MLAACGRIGFDASPGIDSTARAVSSSSEHTCAIVDGTLFCWGENITGELGVGDNDRRLTPARVGPDARWTHVGVGEDHTCGARTDGGIYCWGNNASGQLGLGDTAPRNEPTFVMLVETVESLHTRNDHTCVVHDRGVLTCWGANREGQLGLGDPADSPDRLDPTTVPIASPAKRVSVGQGHTLVISDDDSIAGTGRNTEDQLGLGDGASGQLRRLTKIDGLGTWTGVSGGQSHSCGIRDTQLACWGDNGMGQLGTGNTTAQPAPAIIDADMPWRTVDTNVFHSCGIYGGGTLACWGRGAEGQLGLDDTLERLAVTPTGFADWIAISTGRFYTVGMRADGSVWTTGANDDGQLGTGDQTRRLAWTQVMP